MLSVGAIVWGVQIDLFTEDQAAAVSKLLALGTTKKSGIMNRMLIMSFFRIQMEIHSV